MTQSYYPPAISQLPLSPPPFPSRISLRLPRTYNILRSVCRHWPIPLYPPFVRKGGHFPSRTRVTSAFPSPSTPTTDDHHPRTASDSNGGLRQRTNLRTSGLGPGLLDRRLLGFVIRIRFCLAVYVNLEVPGVGAKATWRLFCETGGAWG